MKLTKKQAYKLHYELWDWLYHNPSRKHLFNYILVTIILKGTNTMKETKRMTIVFPIQLWRKLKYMVADSKIKSIQDYIINLLNKSINK